MQKYLFILTLVFSLTIELLKLGHIFNNGLVSSNTLDLSWQTDMVERLLHGYIAGKHFVFTYGPLFQFIYSIPSIIIGTKSFISILITPIIIHILNLGILFFIITNLFKNLKFKLYPFIYIALILSITNFDNNNILRTLIPLFYITLLYKYFSFKKPLAISNLLIIILPSIFGLYSYDLFIYCAVGILIYLLYNYNTKPLSNIQKFTRIFIFVLVGIAIGQILLSLLLNGDLNYIIYSIDTLRGYRYIMNIPFSFNPAFSLFIFPGLIFLTSIILLFKKKSIKTINKLIIPLNLMALVQLNNLFIRFDEGHILIGTLGSILLLQIYIFYFYKKNMRLFIILIITLFILTPNKQNLIRLFNFNNIIILSSVNNATSFHDIYRFSNDYYFSEQDIQDISTLIIKNSQNTMIYPYDSYMLNINKTTYNTLALQFYPFSGSLIENDTVKLLANNPPKYIILGIDSKGAVMLDNIPNFSRNPLTAKWMLENYFVYKKTAKYLILQKGKKSKNIKREIADCQIYDVDVSEIMKSNIIENFTKTSTYYLNNYDLRLPYTADTKEILIIKNHTSAEALTKLFNSNINFDKYKTHTKKLKIIKKHPMSLFKEEFNKDYKIRCY